MNKENDKSASAESDTRLVRGGDKIFRDPQNSDDSYFKINPSHLTVRKKGQQSLQASEGYKRNSFVDYSAAVSGSKFDKNHFSTMIIHNQDGAHSSDFISEEGEDVCDPGISQIDFAYNIDIVEKKTRKYLHRGRSTTTSAVDDDGEASPVPLQGVDLDEVLKGQENILHKRQSISLRSRPDIYGRSRHSRKRRVSDNGRSSLFIAGSVEDEWKDMIEQTLNMESSFFSNEEALLKRRGSISGRRGCFYTALHVNEKNCHDVADLCQAKYEPKKAVNWRGWSSFGLIKSSAGQLMRWAIAAKVLEREDGWNHQALFSLYLKENLIRCFINYFILNSAPATVYSKCYSLIVIGRLAQVRLSDKPGANQKVEVLLMFLNSTFNAAKCKATELSRMRQEAEEGVSAQSIVAEQDIRKRINLAKRRLEDVKASFISSIRKSGVAKTVQFMSHNKQLVDKWALNFPALLVLTGGGQRPQTYANLQCPSGRALKEIFEMDITTSATVGICTSREKSARSLDIPNVNFPTIIVPYLKLHIRYFRKITLQKSNSETNLLEDSQPLLLHSRYGEHLTSTNISHSISLFMAGVNSRLQKVTAMTLRASYGTSMLHQFRSGKLGEGMTEDKILELTAKQMNTSVEHLRGTYASSYRSDFGKTMNLITRHFLLVMEADDDDDSDVNVRAAESCGQEGE